MKLSFRLAGRAILLVAPPTKPRAALKQRVGDMILDANHAAPPTKPRAALKLPQLPFGVEFVTSCTTHKVACGIETYKVRGEIERVPTVAPPTKPRAA